MGGVGGALRNLGELPPEACGDPTPPVTQRIGSASIRAIHPPAHEANGGVDGHRPRRTGVGAVGERQRAAATVDSVPARRGLAQMEHKAWGLDQGRRQRRRLRAGRRLLGGLGGGRHRGRRTDCLRERSRFNGDWVKIDGNCECGPATTRKKRGKSKGTRDVTPLYAAWKNFSGDQNNLSTRAGWSPPHAPRPERFAARQLPPRRGSPSTQGGSQLLPTRVSPERRTEACVRSVSLS